MVGKGLRSGVLCTSYFLSLKHRLERPLKLFFNMKSVSHWPRFLSHSTLFIYETIGISGFPYRKFIKSSFVLTSYGLWRFWWLPLGHKSCHYLYIPSATMHFMDICVPACQDRQGLPTDGVPPTAAEVGGWCTCTSTRGSVHRAGRNPHPAVFEQGDSGQDIQTPVPPFPQR